jgi:hypothetical protein
MADNAAALAEARRKMIEKRFGGNAAGAASGGSGTARRKNKVAHKTAGGKLLNSTFSLFLRLNNDMVYFLQQTIKS